VQKYYTRYEKKGREKKSSNRDLESRKEESQRGGRKYLTEKIPSMGDISHGVAGAPENQTKRRKSDLGRGNSDGGKKEISGLTQGPNR